MTCQSRGAFTRRTIVERNPLVETRHEVVRVVGFKLGIQKRLVGFGVAKPVQALTLTRILLRVLDDEVVGARIEAAGREVNPKLLLLTDRQLLAIEFNPTDRALEEIERRGRDPVTSGSRRNEIRLFPLNDVAVPVRSTSTSYRTSDISEARDSAVSRLRSESGSCVV